MSSGWDRDNNESCGQNVMCRVLRVSGLLGLGWLVLDKISSKRSISYTHVQLYNFVCLFCTFLVIRDPVKSGPEYYFSISCFGPVK